MMLLKIQKRSLGILIVGLQMKIKITITVLSFLLISSIATAVCVKGNPSIMEEYADSQSVLIGKVISKKDVPDSGNYYEGDEYTIQVQEMFKGILANTIVVFSENSSGRFPMSVGKTYVLFVYYELGRYQVSNCGNSGLLSEKQNVIRKARQQKLMKIK